MNSRNRIILISVYWYIGCISFLFFLSAINSKADVFLTSENLNTTLKQMERLQLQDNNNQTREHNIYQLGVVADMLSKLLTDEVRAHGAENESLINLALERSIELNIEIRWYGRLKRFFYNPDTYRRYLNIFPNGKYVADSIFQILEWDFYFSVLSDPNSLVEAINKKKNYLERFPGFNKVSEVERYLAIDYFDLWRHYQNEGDSESAKRQQTIALRYFEYMAEKYRDKETGELAIRLIRRFNEELQREDVRQ